MYASDAVSIILDNIEKYLFSPSFSWDRYEFKKRSYQRWAAYEICERIMDHPFDSALDTIENFIFDMKCYACYDKNGLIFQTAAEVAEALALLFV